MRAKRQPSKKQSPQSSDDVERLNRALPSLPSFDNYCLMPAESAQMYYVRIESFRRICEARTVMRWMAAGDFNLEDYMAEIINNRGKQSACALRDDLVEMLCAILKRDPSLRDLLYPQLKRCCVIK